jgi:2-keto-4-pentenoate hydratase/2-oxohepta-3-ene-1,7-dioic acid hydratase in catechol pathway
VKLVRFDEGRVGVVRGDEVVDVSELVGAVGEAWPPVAMTRLIGDFARLRPLLEAAPARGARKLSQVRLLTPVPWPNKVIAYPVNYHEHGAERGVGYRADHQGFFLKPNSSLSGAGEPIVVPPLDRRIDHECELALVIGKAGRNIPRERWHEHVFGYSCLIDVVVRGKEERVTRKGFDTFCPVGPWLVTADEVGDASSLRGRLWVNGALRQDANTRDLVLDLPGMVELASAVMSLYPGDIIATGTPAGVGPIRPGDKVRIEFERVGEMTLDVVAGEAWRAPIFSGPA